MNATPASPNPGGSQEPERSNGQLSVKPFGNSAWIYKDGVGLVTVNDIKHLPCVLAALEKFFADEAKDASVANGNDLISKEK